MKIIFLLFCVSSTLFLAAQNHHIRFENFDIQHYSFEIHLNDTTDIIEGKANIKLITLKPNKNIVLDLVGKNKSTEKGMRVSKVLVGGEITPFSHSQNQLEINLNSETKANQQIQLEIIYTGIPADGLVISENKYGKRTFFGDNWPDRAKHWLPTIDHPSDKATLEFLVYAPEHYEIISNGHLVEKRQLENDYEFTHWKEDVPLSTKLMVIGVADFAAEYFEDKNGIPVSNWVFTENREKGFYNYRFHSKALEYFTELLGPYSYEKLAHVQSKTRYGGMENASCIFYHERTGTSEQSQERLFAHEVAHQWFGNSVTEQNWHHVWLSEGFATYLTHVYNQHFYGEEKFQADLQRDRERIIRYSKQKLTPVIDTTVTDYIKLLNTNSYQKASWFLHMLRNKVGDENFFKGLRKYYTDFQNSTALTQDFQNVMETVSGKDLDRFFQQWLWQAGHPVLEMDWKQSSGNLYISIQQVQKESLFSFPLKIQIFYENGNAELIENKFVGSSIQIINQTKGKVKDIIIDPNVFLLFEETKMK